MPFGKARESMRSSARSGRASGNSRAPWPTTTGQMSRLSSSRSSFSSSHRIRVPLPCTCSSPPGLALSSRMDAGEDGRAGPLRVGEGVRRDVLGLRVQGTDDGVLQILPHAPVAGEELVGAPAEQERVGALVDLLDERHAFVMKQPAAPSAPLHSGIKFPISPAV